MLDISTPTTPRRSGVLATTYGVWWATLVASHATFALARFFDTRRPSATQG